MSNTAAGASNILILTPVKNASPHLERYFENLARLTFPKGRISIGLMEGDSDDDSFVRLQRWVAEHGRSYRRCSLWQRHFGFRLPPGAPRWVPELQIVRRKVLARARNYLLFRALDDEDWVLWMDVDLAEYPTDLIERLLAAGRDIVHPHCVKTPGGATFDLNAWRDAGRTHMDAMRGGEALVRLDSVGGSVLLILADLHRDGLVFPPFLYGNASRNVRRPGPWLNPALTGEIETEGLAMMAADMGVQCWGMPNLEVIHSDQ